jgi:hypothetical protein
VRPEGPRFSVNRSVLVTGCISQRADAKRSVPRRPIEARSVQVNNQRITGSAPAM